MSNVISLAAVRAARQGAAQAAPSRRPRCRRHRHLRRQPRSTGARASAGTGGPRARAASISSSTRTGEAGPAGPARPAARAGTWTCRRVSAHSPRRKLGHRTGSRCSATQPQVGGRIDPGQSSLSGAIGKGTGRFSKQCHRQLVLIGRLRREFTYHTPFW
jgi:hypothetical protein